MGAPSHGWATRPDEAAVEAAPSAGSVDVAEAEDFLRLLHAEYPAAGDLDARLRQVRREIRLRCAAGSSRSPTAISRCRTSSTKTASGVLTVRRSRTSRLRQ